MTPAAGGPEPESAAPAISLELQLTRHDYTRAHRRHFWRSLGWMVICAPLLTLVPIARSPAFRSEIQAGNTGAIATALGIYAGVAAFLALAVELCARSFTSHAVRKTPLALARQRLTFSADGMRSETQSSSGFVRWNSFDKATLARGVFELWLTPAQSILVAANSFGSAEERNAFRALVKSRLGERAKFQA